MEGGEITPPASHYSISATPKSYCTFEDNNEFTPQSIAISDGNSTDWFEIQKHIALRELQQLVNRYNDCFRRLKDTVTFVNLLRQENLKLAAENLELAFQIEENEKENAVVTGLSSNVRSEDLEGKGKKKVGVGDGQELDLHSPRGSGSGSGAIRGGGGGGVPKSISIRSSGFLAVKHPPSDGPQGGGAHRLRLPASPVLHGGEKEGEVEVEVEVYNQGMAKTELCNKWGQTGWCPYGERCQFAHGIEELRPVIRHPRYKTQLCRMLGSGGECPYGHRCHFRHALPNPRDR